MRHRVDGRTFGRRREPRLALLRGLATSLIDRERIETTVAKAKEVRRMVEPLITMGKEGTLAARRRAMQYVYSYGVVTKLFGELADRFKTRAGGYTRILHLGQRRGDGAEMALIELIPAEKSKKKAEKPAAKKKAKPEKAPKKKAA